jgi:hypothetical protein
VNDKLARWIVIGVLGLVFILVFRSQIGGMINRIVSVDLDLSKHQIKVVSTPIGDTTVSVQRSPEALYADVTKLGSNVYVDQHFKFAISWPQNSDWVPSTRISEDQFKTLGYGGPREDLGTFYVAKIATSLSPNAAIVSVFAFPKQGDNIQEAVEVYEKTITQRGLIVNSSSIDQDTGGAVLATSNGTASGVHRLLLGDEYEYLVTMVYVPSTNTSAEEYSQLRAATNLIFNSFRVVS